jgi:hypothetical protein
MPHGWDQRCGFSASALRGEDAEFAGPALGSFQVHLTYVSADLANVFLTLGLDKHRRISWRSPLTISRKRSRPSPTAFEARMLTPTETQAFREAEILREHTRYEGAKAFAKLIRPIVRTWKPLLFHGTRFAKQILDQNKLRSPTDRDFSIHFTRDLSFAVYAALVDFREGSDKSISTVLVCDRARLAQDYSLRCFRDPILDDPTLVEIYDNEADEIIVRRDVVELHRYLTNIIWIEEKTRTVWEERGGTRFSWPAHCGWMASQGSAAAVRQTAEDTGIRDEREAATDALLDRLLGVTPGDRNTSRVSTQPSK